MSYLTLYKLGYIPALPVLIFEFLPIGIQIGIGLSILWKSKVYKSEIFIPSIVIVGLPLSFQKVPNKIHGSCVK